MGGVEEVEIVARKMRFDALVRWAPRCALVDRACTGYPATAGSGTTRSHRWRRWAIESSLPDLRGFCHGARPEGVESYHLDEYIADTLAIADALAGAGTAFHLMGTSIGSSIAWGVAAKHPDAGALVGSDQYSPSVGDPGGNGGVASDVRRSGRAILVLP